MMELESVEISFARNNPYEKSLILNALYRHALMDLGYSMDEHIENIDLFRLFSHENLASSKFLLKVRSFYEDSLTPLEQRIFYTEVLEKGRHYLWWWFEYANPKEYALAAACLREKIARSF